MAFHGATVTSDAGLRLPRELNERLGLNALIERYLTVTYAIRFPANDVLERTSRICSLGPAQQHPDAVLVDQQ